MTGLSISMNVVLFGNYLIDLYSYSNKKVDKNHVAHVITVIASLKAAVSIPSCIRISNNLFTIMIIFAGKFFSINISRFISQSM